MKIDEIKANKVLDNEATAEEARNVVGWFATDEGQKYLSQCLDKEAEALTEADAEGLVPHDIPEQKMKQRFLKEIKPHRQPMMRRWWVAAVLLPFLLLSGSVLFLADKVGLFSGTEYAEFVVPPGEQLRVVLQDGTIVQLNSETRLRYPKQFGMFSRTVELQGEGYFEVAKEKNRSFIVDMKDINIKVTGTKFNAKAYPQEAQIWVTLDEGSVLLQDIKGKQYPMLLGESAEYNRRSGVCEITQPDDMENVSSWRSNSLNFYLTPLREIVKVLERQYDAQFIINDSTLLNSRFTLSTTKVNVQDVLKDLEAVSNISFKQTDNGAFEITDKD